MMTITYNGVTLAMETAPGLFSPAGLDSGTRAMLSCLAFTPPHCTRCLI